MPVIFGKRERDEAEHRALFEVSGMSSTWIVPTMLPLKVIEAGRKQEETVS